MYEENITTTNFSDSAIPLIDQPATDLNPCDKRHHFSEYGCVYEKSPEKTICMSMSEIAEEFGQIADNAMSFENSSAEEISGFKKLVPVAVFSQLEGGRKNRESFLATSLIAVDVDQKGIVGSPVVDVDAMLHIPAHHEHPFRTNVNTYSGST